MKSKYIVFCFTLFFIIFLINHIFFKPFPFFKVNYYKQAELFNSNPKNDLEFYSLPISNSFGKLSIELEEQISLNENVSLIDKIELSTKITRSIQENSLGNIIKDYNQITKNDSDYLEICSEAAKIFVFLMNKLGETARVVWVNGHTITEVWSNDHWIFVDPSSNTLAKNKFTKKNISFTELITSYPDIEFRTIVYKKSHLWDYRDDAEKLDNILKNIKIIFIMNNKEIFSFHKTNEKIKRVFSSMFFNNNFKAKQFIGFNKTKKVGNLGLYMFRLL